MTERGYRPCVGAMLFNRDGLVFVAQRRDHYQEAWQMPQGGIDKNEAPRDAALRELAEETGVTSVEILAESRDWLRYDLPNALIGKIWSQYRGQEQKWFAMRFLGADSEIDLETEHPEFRAWRWIEIEALPRLIVPFKRAVYERAVAEFRHLARPAD